jgi:hypothetical protein
MRLPLALSVVALASPAAALAGHNGEPHIDHYVLRDGSGELIANPAGHPISWERCLPDGGACSPHDDGDGEPQILHVRDDPSGSVFQATQDGVTKRSEAWRGPVHAVEPPRADGDVRVGGHVVPVAAKWEGGWGRESDWLQLQACEGADGTACKVIVDEIKFGKCPPGSGRYLPARYEGWWLKVADARIDNQQPFTLEGYSRPEGVRPLDGSPATATAVVGRIGPGTPPAEDCGSETFGPPKAPAPPVVPADPPAAKATATARSVLRRGPRGRVVVADIRCPARCRVELRLRQGARRVRLKRTLRAGTTAVALPRSDARRLRRGFVSVRVFVGARLVAGRRARFAG